MECFIGQAFCATKKMLCTFQGKLALIPHKYGVKKENVIWDYYEKKERRPVATTSFMQHQPHCGRFQKELVLRKALKENV